ncbi:kinase-like domain-containing protein [Mycena latifolia]|nr:kinase-like domain-containing protein [Mycena latifolia]
MSTTHYPVFVCRPMASTVKFNKFFSIVNNKKKEVSVAEKIASVAGASVASSPPSLSLDSFHVLRLLGKGANSKVYLVQHKKTEELYALKVSPKSGSAAMGVPEEQRVLQSISEGSRYLLSLVGSWHDTSNFYLLTRWCQGPDLATQLVLERKFSHDRARLYLAQLIVALEDLHGQRIIHRDVKPSNIFFDADGNAVLGDLGLGKSFPLSRNHEEPDFVHFEADPNATSGSFRWEECISSERCGTPAFMSPDQHFGNPYSFDTDIWSLGMTFFYMLTGRSPFAGNPRTAEEFGRAAMEQPIVFKEDDGLDEEVQDVVYWLLSKNRPNRTTLREIKGHTFFSCIDWVELAAGKVSTSWKPHAPHVPRTGRPELITVGTPYEPGTDPLPRFTFAYADLVHRAAEPQLATPVKTFFGRVKERLSRKMPAPLVRTAQVLPPPQAAHFVRTLFKLSSPPSVAQSLDKKPSPQTLLVPPLPALEVSQALRPMTDERFKTFQRALRRFVPWVVKSSTAPSVDNDEQPVPEALPVDFPGSEAKRGTAAIPKRKRFSHMRRKIVLDGQQRPDLPRTRGQRLLDWARNCLNFSVRRLAH